MADAVTLNGQTLSDAALARVRKLLAEDAAVLVECVRIDPKGGAPTRRRMVRQWPRISDGERALCEAFLGTFASADNAAPSKTVEGPMANRERFAGTWRMTRTDMTRLRTDPEQQGVYQTLLWPASDNGGSGSLCEESSPLHHEDATVYSESDHIPSVAHRNQKGHIFRAQGNIDPETGLWSGKETDDEARTPESYQTESRTAERVSVTTKGEHQWSPQPDVTVAKPAGASSKGTPTVERTADMDPYGLWSTSQRDTWPVESLRATADTSHPKHDEVEVSASNVAAVPGFDAVCAAAGYAPDANLKDYAVLSGFSVRGNEFGLLDVTASWRVPKAVAPVRATVQRSAAATAVVLHGEHLRAEELAGKHLNDASLANLQAVAGENGATDKWTNAGGKAGVQTGYPIGELRLEMDEFGLWSADLRVTVPTRLCTAHVNGSHKKYSEVDVAFSNFESVPDTLADLSSFADGYSTPEGMANHAVVFAQNSRKNEFGLLDGTLTIRVPKAIDAWQDTQTRPGESTTITTHHEHRESTPAIEGAGEHDITDMRTELDEFGLWNGETRVTTAIPHTWSDPPTTRADGTNATTHFRHWESIPEPDAGANTITEIRADLDDFGLWSAEKRVTTAIPIHTLVSSEHPRWTEYDATFSNWATIPSATELGVPTAPYTLCTGQNVRENEFGFHDGSMSWRVPKMNQTMGWITVQSGDPDSSMSRHWGWNMSPLSLPTLGGHADDIVVYHDSVEVNEFGLTDYVRTAEVDKAPCTVGAQGGWVKTGKGEAKYVFIHNHKDSTLTGNEGYVMLIYTTKWHSFGAYRTRAAALSAASSIVDGAKNTEAIDTIITRDGRWYILTASKVNHSKNKA